MNGAINNTEALLKDLELQWNDHFHMRDQTWKTITNSTLFFIGVVGLEIKDVGNFVMIPAYAGLVVTCLFGWAVATHHRLRQNQKFIFITKYEQLLGIYDIKADVLKEKHEDKRFFGKVFTARYIEIIQICIGLVALVLLLRRCFVI